MGRIKMHELIPFSTGDSLSRLPKGELQKLKKDKKIKIKRAILTHDEWGIPCVAITIKEIGVDDNRKRFGN
jgi:hypothetical protein